MCVGRYRVVGWQEWNVRNVLCREQGYCRLVDPLPATYAGCLMKGPSSKGCGLQGHTGLWRQTGDLKWWANMVLVGTQSLATRNGSRKERSV